MKAPGEPASLPRMGGDEGGVRAALRVALMAAIRRRDRVATSTYRTAMGAIDNAGAVPIAGHPAAGAVESASVGVGAAEVPRTVLTEEQLAGVVRAEIEELRTAAEALAGPGSDELCTRADLLDGVLAEARAVNRSRPG